MNYYCNPINVTYRYQFNKNLMHPDGEVQIDREAADPSLIYFISVRAKPVTRS